MQLRDELLNDPNGLGYASFIASGNDAAIAQILNVKNISVNGTVSVNNFAMWCASTGMRAVIEDAAHNSASSFTPLRSIALVLLDLLQGNLHPESLNLGILGNLAMLNAWVTAGAITQAQEAQLIALSQTMISRADQLGIDCSLSAISDALNSAGR